MAGIGGHGLLRDPRFTTLCRLLRQEGPLHPRVPPGRRIEGGASFRIDAELGCAPTGLAAGAPNLSQPCCPAGERWKTRMTAPERQAKRRRKSSPGIGRSGGRRGRRAVRCVRCERFGRHRPLRGCGGRLSAGASRRRRFGRRPGFGPEVRPQAHGHDRRFKEPRRIGRQREGGEDRQLGDQRHGKADDPGPDRRPVATNHEVGQADAGGCGRVLRTWSTSQFVLPRARAATEYTQSVLGKDGANLAVPAETRQLAAVHQASRLIASATWSVFSKMTMWPASGMETSWAPVMWRLNSWA